MRLIAHTFRAATAAGLIALLAACGGGDDTPAAKAKTEAKAEAARAEQAKESISGEIRHEGKDAMGKPFVAQLGGNVTLPDDFPKDFPLYPGAEPLAAMSAAGQGTVVSFRSSDAAKPVSSYFQEKLNGSGWAVDRQAKMPTGQTYDVSKEGRKATLMIQEIGGFTNITVRLLGKS